MDFKYALLLIALVILCIIFYFFPFLLAQYFAKRYHKKSGIPQYTARFGVFEVFMYIVGIAMIYFTINGDLEGTELSNGTTGSSQIMNQKEQLVWKTYTSATGSFEVLAPCKFEYSRQSNKEIKGYVDIYKCEIENKNIKDNVDIVFMVTYSYMENPYILEKVGIKELFETTIKANPHYKNARNMKFEEKFGEIFYSFEIEDIVMNGRVIKTSDPGFYIINSYYSDSKNIELASKFINSFSLFGLK